MEPSQAITISPVILKTTPTIEVDWPEGGGVLDITTRASGEQNGIAWVRHPVNPRWVKRTFRVIAERRTYDADGQGLVYLGHFAIWNTTYFVFDVPTAATDVKGTDQTKTDVFAKTEVSPK